ncbi:MAG: RT0821/Lpp0805 family surface protein [Alphaproteobacteria bacterium]|nr:RT0821/Lpp0805 family surface protein [Alphaproteobacteria bacterium]
MVEPRRRYRKIWVHRRYGHRYHGYGHHHDDHNAYQWLAFTAITLGVLDYMTVAQQRAHESAQITATSAPIGQSINWNDNGLQGSVTATREGTSSSGRYCREFRQAVTIGGKVQESYGTACRQPDGAWEIMP